jgi:hypothetical protein
MLKSVFLPLLVSAAIAQEFRPEIPRAWADRDVAGFELPLAQRDRSPRYIKSDDYYALEPRIIYRSYPVYAPGREPVGYREWLRNREPEIIFDAARPKTKEDWIKAGKIVFDSGGRISPRRLNRKSIPGCQFRPKASCPTSGPDTPISSVKRASSKFSPMPARTAMSVSCRMAPSSTELKE